MSIVLSLFFIAILLFAFDIYNKAGLKAVKTFFAVLLVFLIPTFLLASLMFRRSSEDSIYMDISIAILQIIGGAIYSPIFMGVIILGIITYSVAHKKIKVIKHQLNKNFIGRYSSNLLNNFFFLWIIYNTILFFYYQTMYHYSSVEFFAYISPVFIIILFIYSFIYINKTLKNSRTWITCAILWMGFLWLIYFLWLMSRSH